MIVVCMRAKRGVNRVGAIDASEASGRVTAFRFRHLDRMMTADTVPPLTIAGEAWIIWNVEKFQKFEDAFQGRPALTAHCSSRMYSKE